MRSNSNVAQSREKVPEDISVTLENTDGNWAAAHTFSPGWGATNCA